MPGPFLLLLATFLFPPVQRPRAAEEPEWLSLFNGRDLEGWIPKIAGYDVGENYGNTFRVEDGVLEVSYDAYESFEDQFGHLFYETPFSYYILVVEYRFVGEQPKGGPDWAFRNSGVMIHGQPASTMRKEQDFPISIEVQFLGGNGVDERTTANLCTPGTHVVMKGALETEHCIDSTSKTFHGDQWVRVEVEVHGDGVIRHVVDGETVISYEKPQIGGGAVRDFDPSVKQDGKLLTEGSISLQAESHPIEFRKVELLPLAE
ncbi:MAG: 3-keto-disaccharide hydrolase [Vicinamibacteria bacterium]